jgi:hypothetical protein
MTDYYEFRDLAKQWMPFFRTRFRVAIAIRDREGVLRLCYAFTTFGSQHAPNLLDVYVETKSIRAVRLMDRLDSDTAEQFVSESLDSPESFKFEDGVVAEMEKRHSLTFKYDPDFPAEIAGPLRLPSITLLAEQRAEVFPRVEDLNHELLCAKEPFDGLQDLLQVFVIQAVSSDILMRPCARIIIYPPAFVTFSPESPDNISLKNGKLGVEVTAHSRLDRQKLRLGIRLFPQSPKPNLSLSDVRRSFCVADYDGREEQGMVRTRFELTEPDLPLAQIILGYSGQFAREVVGARRREIAKSAPPNSPGKRPTWNVSPNFL